MTIPTLMNCGHSEDGWCLACVRDLAQQVEDLQKDAARCRTKRQIDLIKLLEKLSPRLPDSEIEMIERAFIASYDLSMDEAMK